MNRPDDYGSGLGRHTMKTSFRTMRGFLPLVAVLIAAATFVSAAESLLILRGGASVWVSGVRTEGETTYYTPAAETGETAAAVSEVVAVIPAVERGKQVAAEEAEATLKLVEKMRRLYPKLSKQLVLLKHQWEAVVSPDSDMGGQIDALVAKFAASRDAVTYKDVCLQLEMLRFKDVLGAYSNRIDAAVAEMHKGFGADTESDLNQMLNADEKTAANYNACRKLAGVLEIGASPEERKALDEAMRKLLTETLNYNCALAKALFVRSKSADDFVAAHSGLCDFKSELNESAAVNAEIDRFMERFRKFASEACPDYDFTRKGFPLNAADLESLENAKDRTGADDMGGLPLEEECLLFPASNPDSLTPGEIIDIRFGAVFNRAQPRDREYAIVGFLKNAEGRSRLSMWRLPEFRIADHRAEVPFRAQAPEWVLGKGPNTLVLLLACKKDTGGKAGEGTWTALGLGCPFPVQ